jgi:hypothetical protein
MKKLFFLLLCLWFANSQAQFTISNGSLTISGGTEFFAEGIHFRPASRLSIVNTRMQQTTTAVSLPNSLNSINKVLLLSSPVEFTGTLHFSYDESALNGNAEGSLKLAYLVSGTWRSSAAGVVNTTDNFIEEAVVSKSFEGLTASAYFTTLPVSLISFTAGLQNNGSVLLQWHTATEINNSHFTIERSRDASLYTAIGSVPAAAFALGQGNYEFTDVQPFAGTNYYRLRQHDLDGAEHVYGVRLVKAGDARGMVKVQPNPVTGDGFMLDMRRVVTDPLFYSISNAAGQVIATGRITSQQQWITTGKLPAGSYLLQVGSEPTVRFQKQ